MKQQVSFLIIATVLLASCQREQDWNSAPDIKAKVETESKTRTSLSVDESGAGTIYWNPADKIDVFFGTTKASYTSQNAADAMTALFKTTDSFSGSGFSSTNIWGLYPSSSTSSCDGSAITTTLPSTQYGVPNTFDNDLFMAVAHSTSTSLQFYNVCGGIKFNLAYDDIKKVTLRGNNNEDLAGTVSISFVGGLPKATIINGVKEITLTPKTGATFIKGADYYFTLLPGTLSEGFTMEFTTVDGSVAFLNYVESAITIKRSVFARKGNLDVYASFGDDRQPSNVIYYTSTDGQIVTPTHADAFGANIVSNEYVGGRGIITFDGDVTGIGDNAFDHCRRLTSIEIPHSVTSIGVSAFYGCEGLTTIEIPNSVTSIGGSAFYYCSGLTSIEIPNSVMSIGWYAFCYCRVLTSIEIPNSVTSIGEYAFSCSGLTSIVVASDNTHYDSRSNCNAIINSNTNELITGCTNTVIPNSVTSIGVSAFYGCKGLTTIEIPNSVSSIGYGAFSGCSGLTSIVVVSDNTHYDSRNNCNAIINSYTNELISGCKYTVIPNTVTSIGEDAFNNSGLTSIEIPGSVTRIGNYAFVDCTGLTSIVLYSTTPPLGGKSMFGYTNNCPIYVPAGSVDAYKTAQYWSDYADRIHPLGDRYEAVDLGLSVKWATCNLGATEPEGYGDYYAWGETDPYYSSQDPLTWKEGKTGYDWASYQWCNGSSNTLTRYCPDDQLSFWGGPGTPDGKTEFKDYNYADDAARHILGGKWRTPTDAEWTELRSNCTWTWTTQNGVTGYRVTSNKTGYTDKSIFLPAAGGRDGAFLYDVGSYGLYWSSSLDTDVPYYAWYVLFNSGTVFREHFDRYCGQSVRPVSE